MTTSHLRENEFGVHLFSACDYHNPELEGRGERRGGHGNMTIRQMGEGGSGVGDGGGGYRGISFFSVGFP